MKVLGNLLPRDDSPVILLRFPTGKDCGKTMTIDNCSPHFTSLMFGVIYLFPPFIPLSTRSLTPKASFAVFLLPSP